jgi:hypothetical protein
MFLSVFCNDNIRYRAFGEEFSRHLDQHCGEQREAMIDEAISELSSLVSTQDAISALGVDRAT